MKHFFLTLISFVFISGFFSSSGWGQAGTTAGGTAVGGVPNYYALPTDHYESCLANANKKPDLQEANKAAEQCKCLLDKDARPVYLNCQLTVGDLRQQQQTCDEKSKAYTEAKLKSPCKGQTNQVKCQAAITECVNSIGSGLANPNLNSGNTVIDTIASQMSGILQAKNASSKAQNSATNFQPDRSCYKKIKSTNSEAIKARAAKMKELQDKIEAQMEKTRKAQKEQNDKKKESDEKIASASKDLKKAILDIDKTKQKEATDLAKQLQDSATNIRNKNSAKLQKKYDLEKAMFEHTQQVKNFTQDKVNSACSKDIALAKKCLIKNAKGNLDPKDPCAKDDYLFSGNTKGAAATAEIHNRVKEFTDKCYQTADDTIKLQNYNYNETIQKFKNDIAEIDAQIKTYSDSLDAAKKSADEIATLSDKEKSQAQEDADTVIQNLKSDLDASDKNTKDSISDSEKIIAQVQTDLEALKAGKIAEDIGADDGSNIYDDIASTAQESLDQIDSAAKYALDACCISPLDINNKRLCDNLRTDTTKIPAKPSKKSSKNKTNN